MRARPRTILSPAQAQAKAAEFIAARRWHGTATMTAGTGEQTGGQQGGQGGEAAAQAGEQQQSTSGGQGSGQATGQAEAKFSQADLDRIIGERVAAEKTKHEKALADAQALAGKNETEKLTIERDQERKAREESEQRAAQRIARTEAKGVARDLDARPDRLSAIIAQADLSKAVKDDGDVDEAAVKVAVEKVLTDYPEWKKTTGTGPSASGGELNGGQSGKPTFTRKQLDEMPPDEMAKRIEEINEAIADGRVTG